jgi:phosphoglycolate phosphatase
MLEYYNQHLLDYTRPYPGVFELVQSLKSRGAVLYVVTNKPQAQASTIVENLFPGCFSGVAGQREGMPTKPDPWGIQLFMKESGFTPEDCLFVGDSNVDAQTAAAGGLACAGVTWGFRSREELLSAGAAWTVDTADELNEIIG